MKSRKYIALLLSFTIFIANISFSFAETTVEEQRAELENIEAQKQKKEKQMEQARKKEQTAAEKLAIIENQLSKANAELKVAADNLNNVQSQIDECQVEIAVAEKRLAANMKIYGQRLRDIFKNGQMNYLDVLIGAADFNDFSSRMELLQRIVKKDLEILDQINREKLNIMSRQVELEKAKVSLVAVKKIADDKKQEVAGLEKAQRAIYEQAIEERTRVQREMDELEETSRYIAQMIRRLEGGGSSGVGTGAMQWPYEGGTITSYYGWRIHPIFGTSKYHSGMDIAADYGDPVMAADSGTVIYSGWMSGYGYTIILDHGGGLTTLYAHNQSLAVTEGTAVFRGQTVAFVGSTGYSTGPHVHFEVRVNGELADPLNYLP